MSEIDLLQDLLAELHEFREIAYCAGIACVFLLGYLSGKR